MHILALCKSIASKWFAVGNCWPVVNRLWLPNWQQFTASLFVPGYGGCGLWKQDSVCCVVVALSRKGIGLLLVRCSGLLALRCFGHLLIQSRFPDSWDKTNLSSSSGLRHQALAVAY